MTGPENGPSATPTPTPSPSFDYALAMRATVGGGAQPLPAKTYEYHSEVYPTLIGGVNVGCGSGAALSMSDASGGGTDARGSGRAAANGAGYFIQIDLPNGNYTLHAKLGLDFTDYTAAVKVQDGGTYGGSPGSVLLATISGTAVHGVSSIDATGTAIAYASFFASETGIPITIAQGHVLIYSSGDLNLNWVRIVGA